MIVLMLAMLVASCVAAPSALGWANGPDVGGVGNGMGTHDWVLEDAIAFAGSGGSWIDKDAALLASDNPDTNATNSNLHLFRDAGIGRGAPSEVATLYYQAVVAYRERHYTDASYYVGVLSHYYSDICQPFHTDYYGAILQDDRHKAYELAVDKYQREVGQFSPDRRLSMNARPFPTCERRRLLPRTTLAASTRRSLVRSEARVRSGAGR